MTKKVKTKKFKCGVDAKYKLSLPKKALGLIHSDQAYMLSTQDSLWIFEDPVLERLGEEIHKIKPPKTRRAVKRHVYPRMYHGKVSSVTQIREYMKKHIKPNSTMDVMIKYI